MASYKVIDGIKHSATWGVTYTLDTGTMLDPVRERVLALCAAAGLPLYTHKLGIAVGGRLGNGPSGNGQYGFIVHYNTASGPLYLMRSNAVPPDNADKLAREEWRANFHSADSADAVSYCAQPATRCVTIKATDASMACARVDPFAADRIARSWLGLVVKHGVACAACDPRADARRALAAADVATAPAAPVAQEPPATVAADVDAATAALDGLADPAAPVAQEPPPKAPKARNGRSRKAR